MTKILRSQHTKVASSVTQKLSKNEDLAKYEEPSDQPPVFFFPKTQEIYDVQNFSEPTEVIYPKLKDDQEKFPTKIETNEEGVILSRINQTKLIQSWKKAKAEIPPEPPVQYSSSKPERTIFSDDEPIQMNPDPLATLNAQNPKLWHYQDAKLHFASLPNHYLMLSKSRLTALVCITSAAGYGLASSAIMAFDPVILIGSTIGVGLCSAAANSINQILEVPFDSQMNRTRNRVLVKGLLTPWHAGTFAFATATSGTVLMWYLVNPVASMLTLANLFLYTSVYTPMKRLSIYNTWVGSIVGALPPIIGWVSATGTLDIGALVLGGILYTWQFPHFNSLSWNLRPDYSRAGYRMMSVTDPGLCKRVALRHSIGCLLVCSVGAPLLDVTTYEFAVDSLPLNAYLVYLSWKFYQEANSSSSRKLFRYTLIHLPLLMILMFISRKRKKSD